MLKNEKITATDKTEAWKKANEIFPYDYIRDDEASANAGYDVYRATAEGKFYYYINDLNDRLEVCMDAKTVNIWIEPERWYTADEVKAIITAAYKELGEIRKIKDAISPEMKRTEIGECIDNLLRGRHNEIWNTLEKFGL